MSPPTGRVARLIRDPLARFLLLGALLFAAFGAAPGGSADREIVVDAGVRRALALDHERRAGRAPTAAEEEALVRRWADEEMVYREALALGLDRGDIIVRRRMLQKMEFLAEGTGPTAEPSDADLQRHLDAHADRWTEAPRLAFDHVFVSTDRHPGDAEALARGLLARLAAGADATGLGDPFPRGRAFGPATAAEIDAAFGPGFAAAVAAGADGRWSGPVRSGFGVHLVRPRDRAPGGRAALDRVRESVRGDWLEERRAAAREFAMEDLRRRYRVRSVP